VRLFMIGFFGMRVAARVARTSSQTSEWTLAIGSSENCRNGDGGLVAGKRGKRVRKTRNVFVGKDGGSRRSSVRRIAASHAAKRIAPGRPDYLALVFPSIGPCTFRRS